MVTVKATYFQVYDNGDFDPEEIREAIIHKIKKEMIDVIKDNSLTKDGGRDVGAHPEQFAHG